MVQGTDSPRELVLWAVGALAAAALVVWLLFLARDALLLIYASALFAAGISPLVRLIETQRLFPIGTRRFPRWLAILTVYVLILAVLAGIGFTVVPPLIRQARELTTELPRLTEQAQRFLIERGILTEPITLKEAIQQAPGRGTDAVGTVLGALWTFAGGVLGLVTMVILTFYFLLDAEAVVAAFVRLFRRPQRARVGVLVGVITRKVSAWLAGQLLLAGVIGASSALGLGLLGVPFFYVLAVIAAVGEMIPVVGPILAAIPGILIALTVSWKLALGVAVFYLVQQQVEANVFVPKLMERQVGIRALTVIIALVIGSALLGVVGAILAVPTAAILQVLFQELVLTDDEPV